MKFPANPTELAADPYRELICRKRFNAVVDVGVEVGVDRARSCVDLGDTVPGDTVHTGEFATDVQPLPVWRHRHGLDVGIGSSNDRTEIWIELAGRDFDSGDRALGFSADFLKDSADVKATVGLDRGVHRRLVERPTNRVRRGFGRIDHGRPEHRRWGIVRPRGGAVVPDRGDEGKNRECSACASERQSTTSNHLGGTFGISVAHPCDTSTAR